MNEFTIEVHGQRYSISTILCNLFNNFSDKDHFQKQRVKDMVLCTYVKIISKMKKNKK